MDDPKSCVRMVGSMLKDFEITAKWTLVRKQMRDKLTVEL